MATERMHLLERVASGSLRVDRANGVIRDVRIIGYESRNGRVYSREALRRAKSLYEGKQVNFDHPPRTDPDRERSITDRAGWLENVREVDGGLTGDLHLLTSDPRAGKILEAAEKRPDLFGLSHNADGRSTRRDGKVIVEEITAVRSVDIVSDPATTRGLYESVDTSAPYSMKNAELRRKALAIFDDPNLSLEAMLAKLGRLVREHEQLLQDIDGAESPEVDEVDAQRVKESVFGFQRASDPEGERMMEAILGIRIRRDPASPSPVDSELPPWLSKRRSSWEENHFEAREWLSRQTGGRPHRSLL